MTSRLKCENPGSIEYTMTITMTADEWEKLREQLNTAWPSGALGREITSLLAQARRIYWPEVDSPAGGQE